MEIGAVSFLEKGDGSELHIHCGGWLWYKRYASLQAAVDAAIIAGYIHLDDCAEVEPKPHPLFIKAIHCDEAALARQGFAKVGRIVFPEDWPEPS